jgi:hypothetical protein
MLGKLQSRLRERFPKSAAFYDRHHVTITGLLIVVFVGFAVYSGIKAYVLSAEVEKQGHDINVTKQNIRVLQESPCTPDEKTGRPIEPKQCHRNFSQAIALVTSLQSCILVKKAAEVMLINGHGVDVECIHPQPPPASPRSTSASEGTGNSRAGPATSAPEQAPSENPATSSPHQPAGGGAGGGSGGNGKGGSKGGGENHQPTPSTPVPSPPPAAAPAVPPATAPSEGGDQNEDGDSQGGPGSSAVGIKVLPEKGAPVEIEALPGNLPAHVCTPAVKVNC